MHALSLFRLWLVQIRYALTRELAFRANFFAWVIVEFSWFVLQLAFVGVVYHHVDNVAGWSRNEMIVLVSTNQLIQQIFTAFLMPGLTKLPELVRTGKLETDSSRVGIWLDSVTKRRPVPGSGSARTTRGSIAAGASR